jgi:hypothetical protein
MFQSENLTGADHFDNIGVYGRAVLSINMYPMVGSCVHGNELSAPKNCENILH